MQEFITARREEIAEVCRRHHVRSLSVFGSAVRDDFDPERSDVDIIVEFENFPMEEYLDNKSALYDELSARFGRKVDLLTWKSLKNPVIRQDVEATHVTLYAA
jgi:predicted nucleotidyltransferase